MCLGLSQSKCSGIILVIYDDTSSDIHLKRPNEKKRRKKIAQAKRDIKMHVVLQESRCRLRWLRMTLG